MQTSNLKQLLKALLNLRILIFLGLLFIGPSIFAQTDTSISATSDDATQNKNQIEEEHDTKNLDKLLIDYNKDQDQVLKDAAKIIQKDDNGELTNKELGVEQNNDSDERPALKKADLSMFDLKKRVDPNSLKKMQYADALRVALEPLQKMGEVELIKLLKENSKGSTAEVYIDRYPKLAVFTVRLIKSKEALPGLAQIIDDQDRLIHFAGIMITTILIAFFLKRLMKREGRSVGKALGLWFLRFLIISFLRLGIILYFFSTELAPTFNIATKTFF